MTNDIHFTASVPPVQGAPEAPSGGTCIGFHFRVTADAPLREWRRAHAVDAVWDELDLSRPGAQPAVMAELDGIASALGVRASIVEDADGPVPTYPVAVLEAFRDRLRDPAYLADARATRGALARVCAVLKALSSLLLATLAAPISILGGCAWRLLTLPLDFLRCLFELLRHTPKT